MIVVLSWYNDISKIPEDHQIIRVPKSRVKYIKHIAAATGGGGGGGPFRGDEISQGLSLHQSSRHDTSRSRIVVIIRKLLPGKLNIDRLG